MKFSWIKTFFNKLRGLPLFFKDENVSLWKKIVMGVSLLYIIIPIDLIPMLPFDDFIILFFIMDIFDEDLRYYARNNNHGDFNRNFSDKNIVDGVEFTVKDEDDKGGNDDGERN